MISRAAPARQGFLFTLTAFAVLVVPLFFHHSGSPSIGSYSRGYVALLAVAVGSSLLAAWRVACSCDRRHDVLPAQAFLAVLGVIVFLAIGAEWVSRLANPDAFADHKRWGTRRSLIFGIEPTPNFEWTAAGATYHTDRFGFRLHVSDTSWYQAPINAGDVRIFTLGGSSVFGYGLNDTETWSHLLEGDLRARYPGRPITVINGGATGHNSLQSMLRFYLRILPHHPTELVYYEAYNDIKPTVRSIDDAQISEAILFSPTLHDYIARLNQDKNFYLRTNLGYGLSQLVDRLGQKPGAPPDDPGKDHPEIAVQNGEIFVRNVETLSDLCRRYGVRLTLVTFIHDNARLDPYRSRTLGYYNSLIRDLARQEGDGLIDVERDFGNVADKRAYFAQEDHYHPSRLEAEYIAARVAAGLNLDKPSHRGTRAAGGSTLPPDGGRVNSPAAVGSH